MTKTKKIKAQRGIKGYCVYVGYPFNFLETTGLDGDLLRPYKPLFHQVFLTKAEAKREIAKKYPKVKSRKWYDNVKIVPVTITYTVPTKKTK